MTQQQFTSSQADSLPHEYGARRILIADDSVYCREVLGEFLASRGHEVCATADGMEALLAVSRFHPEIAILDICMPRMNGYELCARLRADPAMKDVAVFALTGGSYDEPMPAGALGRFDAYLRKPVEFDVIDGLINVTTALLKREGRHAASLTSA